MTGTGRGLVWIERALVVAGAACLAVAVVSGADAVRVRTAGTAALERLRAAPAREPTGAGVLPRGALVGRLEIPRLGLSAVVLEGDDPDTLRVAAGHLPDTPMPWQPGNSAIAGHRDTFFRPLQRVRAGDRVRLETTRGDLEYVVTDTRVVEPDNLSVLAPTREPSLTLVTCYPFRWIGAAPQRFIVRAARADAGLREMADRWTPR